MGKAFGLIIAIPSCLISAAAIGFCQMLGWKSDGPGLICPMAIGFIFGLVGVSSLWGVLSAPSGPGQT
jgi:hypothetical protein